MNRILTAALAATLATSLPLRTLAQTPTPPSAPTTHFTDPANLGGERVSPRTGRELPIDGGDGNSALGLEQLLRDLNTRASILNIVAHPDDEDGGMLTLYARGLGARVADLSLTRGEGGQNAMTGDFEDALGLLRTQELLANDRYTGVTQMFGTEVDFGFSKTKTESFAKWNHQRVLYDVVRAIRIYRPLVITSTWIGNVTDGHGQHQVSGEIAQEAFKAAGDPNVFPELTREGILPWQPLRMYARVPTQAITSKGLYDYATDQYVTPHFTNYITGVTTSTPPTADITIHEGMVDPLLTIAAADHADLPPSLANQPASKDLSYVQFARIGLSLQKSQIGPNFRLAPSGAFDVNYHLYGSCVDPSPRFATICHLDRSAQRAAERPAVPPPALQQPSALTTDPSFFTGIDTSLESIALLDPADSGTAAVLRSIQQDLNTADAHFNPAHPGTIALDLADALGRLDDALTSLGSLPQTPDRANMLHELRIKRVQLNDAVMLALGAQFSAQADAPSANVVANTPLVVSTRLSTTWPTQLLNQRQMLQTSNGHMDLGFLYTDNAPNFTSAHPAVNTLHLKADTLDQITRPYFSRPNIEQPFYNLSNPELRNAPSTPPALTVWARFFFSGVPVEIGHVVDAGLQPVEIVPALSVSLSSHAQVFPDSWPSLSVGLNHRPAEAAITSMYLGAPGWTSHSEAAAANPPGHTEFALTPPAGLRKSTQITAWETLRDNPMHYSEGYRSVGYGDLPRSNFYTPATDHVVPVDLRFPPANERRIAYLPGTGDAVPQALASIGLKPTILTVADLTPAKLARFDTVILGVRTYNAHPDLHGAPTQALLDYARNGGNVVVQYQTGEFTAADAPYPLTLGYTAAKVIDETAPVKLLDPSNPLLTTPNRITPADFNDWIEERGHGFLGSWDSRYIALTETHDPGAASEGIQPQQPQRGGLITVQFGKGRWTYCAFALYRQLPEAVPGAFRLFMNLIDPASAGEKQKP